MPGESYLRDLWLCLCDVFQGRINWRERQRDRQTDRQTETERQAGIDMETKRERETDSQRATDRHTDRQRESSSRDKCRYERNKSSCICIHDLVRRSTRS